MSNQPFLSIQEAFCQKYINKLMEMELMYNYSNNSQTLFVLLKFTLPNIINNQISDKLIQSHLNSWSPRFGLSFNYSLLYYSFFCKFKLADMVDYGFVSQNKLRSFLKLRPYSAAGQILLPLTLPKATLIFSVWQVRREGLYFLIYFALLITCYDKCPYLMNLL